VGLTLGETHPHQIIARLVELRATAVIALKKLYALDDGSEDDEGASDDDEGEGDGDKEAGEAEAALWAAVAETASIFAELPRSRLVASMYSISLDRVREWWERRSGWHSRVRTLREAIRACRKGGGKGINLAKAKGADVEALLCACDALHNILLCVRIDNKLPRFTVCPHVSPALWFEVESGNS